MGHGPSDAQILNFVSFTGAEQRDAINYLSREPNFEKAVQNYYDAQERGTSGLVADYSSGWNENDMHAGKEYGPETRPSYQIHSVDNTQTLGPEIFNSTLSRPPSRVDLKLDDKEDTDLQHGLINSMSSSRHDASNTVSFGPATREHYPANQWTMTTTTSQHILPDPDPPRRARALGSPAFIKPSTADNRLPTLLTILQQIPLACETLLLREHVRPEYGTSRDWWQGDSIRARGAVVSTDDQSHVDQRSPILDEVQRLMAFLEMTERAYGSTDALRDALESSRYRPWSPDNEADSHLLNMWREECKEIFGDKVKKDIFSTIATEKTGGEVTDQSVFPIFKLNVQYATEIETLYDLIDEVLWGSWIVDSPTEVFIKPGEVLTFHMSQNSKMNGLVFESINWPLVFYVDRYLEENKDAMTKMLHTQANIEEERNNIQMLQTRLELVKASTSSSGIAATELLKVVKPFLDGDRLPVDELEGRDEVVASGARYHPLDAYKTISRDLELVAEGILRKHELLEQEKNQLSAKKKSATDFLKEPAELVGNSPVHRYTLRGISPDPNTIFVLANPNTAEDLLDTEVNNWDWWRIHWDSQKENPVDLQKVAATELNDAVSKANEVIAVYASDRAINFKREPVPSALKNFVRADNLHFAAELEHPEISSRRKAAAQDWSYVQDSAFHYQSRSRNGSIDSMQANLDTDMTDSFYVGTEHRIPDDWKDPLPPPIPPRGVDHRKAPKRPMVEDLIDADGEPQETGTINLMDDDTRYDQEMQEVSNSPTFSNIGILPGGPQSGVSDSVTGNAPYANELQMSDIVETKAQTPPGLQFSHRTVDPSKISFRKDEDQSSLI